MALTIRVDDGERLPRVLVDGGGERVVGRCGRDAWEVVPAGHTGAVVDYMAPLGLPVTYTAGTFSEQVTRVTDWDAAFSSLDGKLAVSCIIPHEWQENLRPEAHVFQPRGARPYALFGAGPVEEAYPITARVTGADVRRMRALIRAHEPVVFYHNQGWCPLRGCPVPEVTVGVLMEAGGSLAPRKDAGEVIFSLSLQPVEGPARPVAARTWADLLSAGTWGAVASEPNWQAVMDG